MYFDKKPSWVILEETLNDEITFFVDGNANEKVEIIETMRDLKDPKMNFEFVERYYVKYTRNNKPDYMVSEEGVSYGFSYYK